MKHLKIILLGLSFLFILTSCENNIISETNRELEKQYVVISIKPGDRKNTVSRYTCSTIYSYTHFLNNIHFHEENGKFAIGDTIWVTFSKASYSKNTENYEKKRD